MPPIQLELNFFSTHSAAAVYPAGQAVCLLDYSWRGTDCTAADFSETTCPPQARWRLYTYVVHSYIPSPRSDPDPRFTPTATSACAPGPYFNTLSTEIGRGLQRIGEA